MNDLTTPSIVDKSEISGFIIERTAKRMKQAFQRMLRDEDTGITADQWVILQELKERDGKSQLEIAQSTYKDAPTVTRIIDLLVDKQLLERLPDPGDRRKFNIYLTVDGKSKIAEVLPIINEFRSIGWNGLSDEAIHEMTKTLDHIFHNLKK